VIVKGLRCLKEKYLKFFKLLVFKIKIVKSGAGATFDWMFFDNSKLI